MKMTIMYSKAELEAFQAEKQKEIIEKGVDSLFAEFQEHFVKSNLWKDLLSDYCEEKHTGKQIWSRYMPRVRKESSYKEIFNRFVSKFDKSLLESDAGTIYFEYTVSPVCTPSIAAYYKNV